MTWEYRICYRKSSPAPGLQIHEVFYDEEGSIKHYTKTPVVPYGDIEEELYQDMCKMMDAFDKQPLNLDHIDYLLKTNQKRKAK